MSICLSVHPREIAGSILYCRMGNFPSIRPSVSPSVCPSPLGYSWLSSQASGQASQSSGQASQPQPARPQTTQASLWISQNDKTNVWKKNCTSLSSKLLFLRAIAPLLKLWFLPFHPSFSPFFPRWFSVKKKKRMSCYDMGHRPPVVSDGFRANRSCFDLDYEPPIFSLMVFNTKVSELFWLEFWVPPLSRLTFSGWLHLTTLWTPDKSQLMKIRRTL